MPADPKELTWTETLRWVQWALSHSDKFATILTMWEEITTAIGYRAKWEHAKPLGDIIFDIIETAPLKPPPRGSKQIGSRAAFDKEAEPLKAQAERAGLDWDTLLAKLPEIVAFIKAMWDAFRS